MIFGKQGGSLENAAYFQHNITKLPESGVGSGDPPPPQTK